MSSKLTKVIRLDNLPIGRAYFTTEGLSAFLFTTILFGGCRL